VARKRSAAQPDPATEAMRQAAADISRHPLFAPLHNRVRFDRETGNACPADGWAVADSSGVVHLHPSRRAEPEVWTWVLAHALLHLGFGHLDDRHRRAGRFDAAWNAAACATVNRFLTHLKFGRPPIILPASLPAGDEERLAEDFRLRGIPAELRGVGTAGPGPDLAVGTSRRWGQPQQWEQLLADGLSAAVQAAVAVAGGELATLAGGAGRRSRWQRALSWFVASYPLLGPLAAAFDLVEDADLCRRMDISVAAVSAASMELYVNPQAGLSDAECRFVIAHELLHAGLRHDTRAGARDPYLWNIACDYVINGWLIQMGVGEMADGLLYDPELKGRSAEEVYDRIATDLRRFRKLATVRGVGLCDVLPGRLPRPGEAGYAVDLDEFYRRALAQGLEYHCAAGRGLLPEGLIEEIRALSQPPVPWDVELARWFDDHFPAVEHRRSYARPSRRQSATPDIPRPAYIAPDDPITRRTFGVVLDTSGSMDSALLGKALGAIASYSLSREVPAARVVFCDAAAYDAGYLAPDDIAGRVKVRGRGGTVLQPGIDLLERAVDFPKDGPILVITDGWCDRVRLRREHAFLIPAGARLPFVPRGPVFRIV